MFLLADGLLCREMQYTEKQHKYYIGAVWYYMEKMKISSSYPCLEDS